MLGCLKFSDVRIASETHDLFMLTIDTLLRCIE
jgi:hypothetical protein